MIERTHRIMGSIHPSRIDALVAEMAKDGWSMAPPWPSDEGIAYFSREVSTPPVARPLPPDWQDAMRVTRPSGWFPFWFFLFVVVVTAATAGWITR